METPVLHELLEQEKISELLANFTQMFPAPIRVWLVEVEGQVLGYHPVEAQGGDVSQLRLAIDQVRQLEKMTPVPLGMAAPVQVRGRVVGALIVALPQTPKSSEIAALQFLAHFLSLLGENSLTQKALLHETFDRYRELNLLYHMGETVVASLDLPQVNRLLLDESIRLTQADEGAVMLVDRESGQLTVWASNGLDAIEDIGPGIPLGYELAEQVLRSGETQVVERPELGRRKRPLTALLCVPLKAKDQVLGVISLVHTRPGRTFHPNDIKLLNNLVRQAAIAIENARLFSDLNALHAELEAANRRLLELNQLKSSFLSIVTHELRTPFTNIDWSLQLIERYGTQQLLPQQQEQFAQLTRFVKKAYRMIDSLVSFAALLSKQGNLFLAEVDFPTLVNKVVRNMAQFASYRQVELLVDEPEALPPILADEMRLSEAIHHLVHNAIKFNQPGGTVRVRYWLKDERVVFEVQDTGIGIPPDKLSSLGKPFSQVADPLKRGVEGLGLGLALASYIVRAHGGRVGISSQEGVGSTFRFWLPVAGP
jgi:signal transduction histidine kinase